MPSSEDQDLLFAQLHRVLRPGGIFVGQDSLDLEPLRAAHADDTFTPVDPDRMKDRLAAAGFGDTKTDIVGFHFRFVSQKPG
jgi:predicted methyltransferase